MSCGIYKDTEFLYIIGIKTQLVFEKYFLIDLSEKLQIK